MHLIAAARQTDQERRRGRQQQIIAGYWCSRLDLLFIGKTVWPFCSPGCCEHAARYTVLRGALSSFVNTVSNIPCIYGAKPVVEMTPLLIGVIRHPWFLAPFLVAAAVVVAKEQTPMMVMMIQSCCPLIRCSLPQMISALSIGTG